MIDLRNNQSIDDFVKYAKIREGEAVANKVREKLGELQAEGKEMVDGFDVMVPIAEELKPGLAEAWHVAGGKRVVASLQPKTSDDASAE